MHRLLGWSIISLYLFLAYAHLWNETSTICMCTHTLMCICVATNGASVCRTLHITHAHTEKKITIFMSPFRFINKYPPRFPVLYMCSVFLSLVYIQFICLSPSLSHFVAALRSAHTAEMLTMIPIIHSLHCWIHGIHPAQGNTAATQNVHTHRGTSQIH